MYDYDALIRYTKLMDYAAHRLETGDETPFDFSVLTSDKVKEEYKKKFLEALPRLHEQNIKEMKERGEEIP